MADFEKIVRPFESELVFTARKSTPESPAPDSSEVDESIVVIEGKANAEYQEDPPPYTLGLQVDWVEDRSERVTTQERVENPDDASQFVEIEKIDKMEIVNTVTRDRIIIRPFEEG